MKKTFPGEKKKKKQQQVFSEIKKNKNEELRKFILAKPVVNSGGKNILEKKKKIKILTCLSGLP